MSQQLKSLIGRLELVWGELDVVEKKEARKLLLEAGVQLTQLNELFPAN